jgi:GWxTD domain-containing protein
MSGEGEVFPSPGPEVERGLAALVEGGSLAMMAYGAAQKGDFKGASLYYQRAADRFEEMPSDVRGVGLSRAVCRSYAEGLRRRAKAGGQEMGRSICADHLRAIGGFLKGYIEAHDGRYPADLRGLKAWMEQRHGPIGQLFRAPVDADAGRAVSYGYRLPCPGDPDGTPVAWSYFYAGRGVELTRSGDAFTVIIRALGQVQADSLLALGLRDLEADSLTAALKAFEEVTSVAPNWPIGHSKLGYARLRAGDLDHAEASFLKATGLNGRLAEGHHGLGMVFAKRPKGLYTAIGYFVEALRFDPRYVEARYHLAEARMRLEEYDARREVERAIVLDPTYAPAYRLMGEWHETMQEDYEAAALWYTRYLALKPDDPEVRVRLGGVYQKARDFERVTKILMDHAQAHPEDIEALPILAHACAEMRRLDWAQTFYQRYLNGISPDERALYEDVRLVGYPEEIADCEAAVRAGQREAFLRHFWAVRDPDLMTAVNERLLEHYRRVWYARQNFSRKRQPWDRRGEVYVRFGEPDYRSRSDMLNLRQGLAVQRVKERMAQDLYGREAENLTYFGPAYPVRGLRARLGGVPDLEANLPTGQLADLMAREADARQRQGGTEAPRQEGVRLRGETEVTAADLEQFRVEETRTVRRESPRGGGVVSGGMSDFHPDFGSVSVQEDASQVPWETWVYVKIGGGIEITFTDERGSGDYDYAPPPLDAHIPIHQLSRFNRYAPQRVFERAAAVTPDHYTPKIDAPPLQFYYDLADFRASQEGRSVLEVYYGIPRGIGQYLPEQDSTRMVVERQVALLNLETGATFRTQSELVFEGAGDLTRQAGAFVPDVARLEAPPGRYRMEVSARDRLSGRMGTYRQDVEVGDYAKGRLRLSGLELAWQVSRGEEGDRFTRHGTRIVPLPTRTFRRDQGVFIYYEVYNLKPDVSGVTRHAVEYTVRTEAGGVLSRIAQTFSGRRPEVAVSQEQAGTQEADYRYLELDLRGLSPGKGLLTVTVKDLNSGEAVSRGTSFAMME